MGGVVYLLHFDVPYKHARHYLGFTENLEERLREHGTSSGGRLMQVVKSAGIGWQLARTWEKADRARERQLKKMGGRRRLCPICRAEKPRTLF